jgi:hypothetical protein
MPQVSEAMGDWVSIEGGICSLAVVFGNDLI